jgi:hypothetical protein
MFTRLVLNCIGHDKNCHKFKLIIKQFLEVQLVIVTMNVSLTFSPIHRKLFEEQALFEIGEEQIKLNEKYILDSENSLIFLLRNIFSLHLSIVQQSYSINNNYQNIESFEIFTLRCNINEQVQNIIKSYLNNPLQFANSVESFLSYNPDYEHVVVFSLIPAIYSSFWSDEEYLLFFDFFQHLQIFKSTFSRLFLSHPSFFTFFFNIFFI